MRTGIRAFGDVYWLAGLKLGARPLVVWLLGRLAITLDMPLGETELVVLVLVSALPSAANASMLAERFAEDNGRIARVILGSTVLGFVTLSVVTALLV